MHRRALEGSLKPRDMFAALLCVGALCNDCSHHVDASGSVAVTESAADVFKSRPWCSCTSLLALVDCKYFAVLQFSMPGLIARAQRRCLLRSHSSSFVGSTLCSLQPLPPPVVYAHAEFGMQTPLNGAVALSKHLSCAMLVGPDSGGQVS